MSSGLYIRGLPIAFAVVAIALLVAGLIACSRDEPLVGTVLNPLDPTPGFQLTDQLGRPATLSDFEDKVVALTFLYTYCPDICPAATSQLKRAHDMLGEDADQVSFVAVSVDPERDSIQQAYEFSEKWGMLDKWSFLVGD